MVSHNIKTVNSMILIQKELETSRCCPLSFLQCHLKAKFSGYLYKLIFQNASYFICGWMNQLPQCSTIRKEKKICLLLENTWCSYQMLCLDSPFTRKQSTKRTIAKLIHTCTNSFTLTCYNKTSKRSLM